MGREKYSKLIKKRTGDLNIKYYLGVAVVVLVLGEPSADG